MLRFSKTFRSCKNLAWLTAFTFAVWITMFYQWRKTSARQYHMVFKGARTRAAGQRIVANASIDSTMETGYD